MQKDLHTIVQMEQMNLVVSVSMHMCIHMCNRISQKSVYPLGILLRGEWTECWGETAEAMLSSALKEETAGFT